MVAGSGDRMAENKVVRLVEELHGGGVGRDRVVHIGEHRAERLCGCCNAGARNEKPDIHGSSADRGKQFLRAESLQ